MTHCGSVIKRARQSSIIWQFPFQNKSEVQAFSARPEEVALIFLVVIGRAYAAIGNRDGKE